MEYVFYLHISKSTKRDKSSPPPKGHPFGGRFYALTLKSKQSTNPTPFLTRFQFLALLPSSGLAAIEDIERVFDQNGDRIGSVWVLGFAGRKMYALYNGEYELSETGFLKIEYMDSGYFDCVEF